jgi:hypothetical protein
VLWNYKYPQEDSIDNFFDFEGEYRARDYTSTVSNTGILEPTVLLLTFLSARLERL